MTPNKIQRQFSSGGVVFDRVKKLKNGKAEVLWLIRKTAKSKLYPKTYWMLPKGWIDDAGEGVPGPMASGKVKADTVSLKKAAIREVEEETGVDAKILKKIGTVMYTYLDPDKNKILKFVTFFLMKKIKDRPGGFDNETSKIEWLTYKNAYKKLSFYSEKSVLKKSYNLISFLTPKFKKQKLT